MMLLFEQSTILIVVAKLSVAGKSPIAVTTKLKFNTFSALDTNLTLLVL